jgi:hypothetical protein
VKPKVRKVIRKWDKLCLFVSVSPPFLSLFLSSCLFHSSYSLKIDLQCLDRHSAPNGYNSFRSSVLVLRVAGSMINFWKKDLHDFPIWSQVCAFVSVSHSHVSVHSAEIVKIDSDKQKWVALKVRVVGEMISICSMVCMCMCVCVQDICVKIQISFNILKRTILFKWIQNLILKFRTQE